MKMFGIKFDIEDALQTVVTGAASGVGFFFGGPVGGALVGGAVSGLWAGSEALINGKGLGDAFSEAGEAAVIGGLAGAIPGGLAGGGVRGLLHSVGDAGASMAARAGGLATTRQALNFMATNSMPRLGLGAFTSSVGTAVANNLYSHSMFDGSPPAAPAKVWPKVLPVTWLDSSSSKSTNEGGVGPIPNAPLKKPEDRLAPA